jgi:hypothetical protein
MSKNDKKTYIVKVKQRVSHYVSKISVMEMDDLMEINNVPGLMDFEIIGKK